MTDNLESLIFIALGEASMCWSSIDKAGVFKSRRCEEIGKRLVKEINSVLKPATSGNSEEKFTPTNTCSTKLPTFSSVFNGALIVPERKDVCAIFYRELCRQLILGK